MGIKFFLGGLKLSQWTEQKQLESGIVRLSIFFKINFSWLMTSHEVTIDFLNKVQLTTTCVTNSIFINNQVPLLGNKKISFTV